MLFPILSTKQAEGKARWADILLTCGKTLSTIRNRENVNKKQNLLREKFLQNFSNEKNEKSYPNPGWLYIFFN